MNCNKPYNLSDNFGLNKNQWGYGIPSIPESAQYTYLELYCNLSNEADDLADQIALIPYDVGVVASPFVGILLDRIGGTALIMTITPIGFAIAHVLLGLFKQVPALVPLLFQGTSYSFYSAALWAPLAHVMPKHLQGMGYGICTAALNFGTAAFPLIVAAIYDDSNHFYLPNTEYLFIGLSAIAFILGVFLCGVDWKRDKVLSRSHWNDHDTNNSQPLIKKSDLKMRWIMLIFICLLMIGNFYISELTALKKQLGDEFAEMDENTFEFNYELLYTIYAFPNIVLPFFGGVLVDKFGCRSTLLGFGILITVAQCIFALGSNLHMFWLMLAARGLYALGGETITVAQNVILTQWFGGREHAFSFGITLSFCRGGNSLAGFLSPLVADTYGVAAALWLGAIICFLCVLCTVILIPLDLMAERKLKAMNERTELQKGENAEGEKNDAV
jgi:MFS family permease